MELKQREAEGQQRERKLLIVPYGIETNKMKASRNRAKLLIVPYGIETHHVRI